MHKQLSVPPLGHHSGWLRDGARSVETADQLKLYRGAYFGRISGQIMPTYRLTIVNEHFSSSSEQESSDVVKAWQKAIGSAVTIAADQVSHGNPFFGAEVTLHEGNKRIGRYLVSVGATPLKD